MKKNGFIGLLIVLILVVLITVGIFIISNSNSPEKTDSELKMIENQNNEKNNLGENVEEAVVENELELIENQEIEITSSGFFPSDMTINQGQELIFINKDENSHWPASAIHPTHKVYPGSDIDKCGTEEESEIFDACIGLSKGESYSFIFNEKGRWSYHDHLNSNLRGTISVI